VLARECPDAAVTRASPARDSDRFQSARARGPARSGSRSGRGHSRWRARHAGAYGLATARRPTQALERAAPPPAVGRDRRRSVRLAEQAAHEPNLAHLIDETRGRYLPAQVRGIDHRSARRTARRRRRPKPHMRTRGEIRGAIVAPAQLASRSRAKIVNASSGTAEA